jgi:hypothetical protein
MKGKRFVAGERVAVSIDGSQHTGSISRRLDERGKCWDVLLDDGRRHAARAVDIRRVREPYRDPTPEEIAERAAAIQNEWPESERLRRQVQQPDDRLEMRESRLWRRTAEGGLAE